RNQLETLYRLIGRLCLAAQGQSPRLDDQLQRLRDAVRRQVPFEELEPMSKAIADVVHELDAPKPAARTAREVPPEAPATPQSPVQAPSQAPTAAHLAAEAESHPLEPS